MPLDGPTYFWCSEQLRILRHAAAPPAPVAVLKQYARIGILHPLPGQADRRACVGAWIALDHGPATISELQQFFPRAALAWPAPVPSGELTPAAWFRRVN